MGQPVKTYSTPTTPVTSYNAPAMIGVTNPAVTPKVAPKTLSVADKKQKLLAMGYSEAEVNKALGIQTQVSEQAPSLSKSIGDGVINFAGSLAKPFTDTAKRTAGAAYEVYRRGKQDIMGDKNAYVDKSGKVVENPYLSQEDLATLSDPKKGNIEAAKTAAGVLSYAVPFGKAGFVGSKAIVPGAIVGTAQGISQGDSGSELVGDAALGAITAGTLQLGGKTLGSIKNALGKTSKATAESASALEQGTRQIKQPASVFGASKEKAINNTLNKYGIKGTAQQQYEALQPTMQKIEGQIQKFIEGNPSLGISKEEIKQAFYDKLKTSLRSKDITQKQALTEVNGYLMDLLRASGGKGKFTNIDLGTLRNLKKLVNEDYGAVYEKMQRGGTLTSREKVIAVAWDSLDDAVKNISPEVKALLTDESNLYKSAKSLSGARFNPPVLRIAGTSVPAGVTQGARDLGTKTLKGISDVTGGLNDKIPNLSANLNRTVVGQGASRVAVAAGNVKNNTQNTQNNAETYGSYNNSNPDINSLAHDNSLPQNPKDVNFASGKSPEYWNAQYQQAMSQNPPDEITAKYALEQRDYESAYQKSNGAGKGKALTGVQQVLVSNLESASRAVNKVEELLNKDSGLLLTSELPGIGSRLAGASTYNTARKEVADVIGRMRTGAVINDEEMATYLGKMPKIGDRPEDIKYKLSEMRQIFEAIRQRIENQSIGASQTQYDGLGSIDTAL